MKFNLQFFAISEGYEPITVGMNLNGRTIKFIDTFTNGISQPPDIYYLELSSGKSICSNAHFNYSISDITGIEWDDQSHPYIPCNPIAIETDYHLGYDVGTVTDIGSDYWNINEYLVVKELAPTTSIIMNSPEGVFLATTQVYADKDISVIPALEEQTVTANSTITPSENKVALSKVIVNIPNPMLTGNAQPNDVLNGFTYYSNDYTLKTGTYIPLDTSDANVTPDKLLLGKTAYAKGTKVVGTLATYNGELITNEVSITLRVTGDYSNSGDIYIKRNNVIIAYGRTTPSPFIAQVGDVISMDGGVTKTITYINRHGETSTRSGNYPWTITSDVVSVDAYLYLGGPEE